MREDWDTIVIGSGAGGLTAAAALARCGQRVLVLEQHYLPGGWMHSFSLGGYRFSPGVHYVGDCGPGGFLRNLYEGLGAAGDLEFCEMNPDAYDHLIVGGERFDVPRGWDALVQRMITRFPHEREGILRYYDVCRSLAEDLGRVDHLLAFPRVLALPFLAPALTRWGFSTQAALLDRTVKDPLLRAFLAAQNGDHGLAPSRVSLPAHACMITHYSAGAYYPRGGAKSIPRALISVLRRHRGAIRLRTRVQRILVEKDRACGVELESGEVLRARDIVSNADPRLTYKKLLPPGVGPRENAPAAPLRYSVSVVSVFAAVDMDLRGRGFDSGNYWWYPSTQVARAYERSEHVLAVDKSEVEGLFLAITTLKDPGHRRHGHHTIEMFTFAPFEPFARWGETRQGDRGADYERFKERLADRMIAAADNIIPGFSRNIMFRAVGTPVTNQFYCESPFGNAYGTAKSPWQVGPFAHRTRAELDGLHLCGASTLSHGVAGASISGLMAAQGILGARTRDDLLARPDGSLRVFPSEQPETWLPAARRREETTADLQDAS